MPNPLTDKRFRPLRDVRISLTDRCNLRCRYCMPAELFGPDYPFLDKNTFLDFSQIERLCRAFIYLGVEKIRLTGGEPLLRPNLPELVAKLTAISGVKDLALTTNGVRLAPLIPALHQAGLHRVSVSLDALDDATFERIAGASLPVARVIEGITAALAAGIPTKVNMVVVRNVNENQIIPMARQCRVWGVPLRFIEFMDVGNCNGWTPEAVVPGGEILDRVQSAFPLSAIPSDYYGEVAERYRYADGAGEIGLIRSVTKPFCGNCTRARLSADGKLHTCLFTSKGHDLTPLLKATESSPESIAAGIAAIWRERTDNYSESRHLRLAADKPKIEMSYIGG